MKVHRIVIAATSAVILAGCLHRQCACDREAIADQVAARMGERPGPTSPCSTPNFPPGFSPGQPLNEEQAVLVALWANPGFQELLTELRLTQADLIQAGLLPNPEFVYTFSAPHKPFKYLADFALESLWLRPIRIAAAEQENERVCSRLVQNALDLIRDTRQAFADVLLARDRLKIAVDLRDLRGRIGDLAEARLRAGDASVQEASVAKIDSLQAKQDVIRQGFEVAAAEERLRLVLGMTACREPLVLVANAPTPPEILDEDALAAEALQTRPDAVAADRAVVAAAERVRLSKFVWFRFLGILDATSGRVQGNEFSPGFRVTVPIFNWNQGGIARAEAEFERAERQSATLRNQIGLDIRLAATRVRQATSESAFLKNSVRPEVEAAVHRAEKSYENGSASYLIVLETTRQLLDMATREAQLRADLRRAVAELERSVGRRLATPKAPTP